MSQIRSKLLKESCNQTASWGDRGRQMGNGGAKWATGAPAGGAHTQRYATGEMAATMNKKGTQIQLIKGRTNL